MGQENTTSLYSAQSLEETVTAYIKVTDAVCRTAIACTVSAEVLPDLDSMFGAGVGQAVREIAAAYAEEETLPYGSRHRALLGAAERLVAAASARQPYTHEPVGRFLWLAIERLGTLQHDLATLGQVIKDHHAAGITSPLDVTSPLTGWRSAPQCATCLDTGRTGATNPTLDAHCGCRLGQRMAEQWRQERAEMDAADEWAAEQAGVGERDEDA